MSNVVLTGASSGIGAAAARLLATQRPADTLILVGRDPERTKSVAQETGAQYHLADFSQLKSVHALVDKLPPRIDVLAHNAGGMFSGPTTTVDGFELTYQVNVVVPFLLTHLLQDRVERVVSTSSVANLLGTRFNPEAATSFRQWPVTRAYADSKLALNDLTRWWHTQGLHSVAFHPGVVATSFGSDSPALSGSFFRSPARTFFLTPEQGGRRLAYFISGTPGIHWSSGAYYHAPGVKGITRPWGGPRDVVGDLQARLGVSGG